MVDRIWVAHGNPRQRRTGERRLEREDLVGVGLCLRLRLTDELQCPRDVVGILTTKIDRAGVGLEIILAIGKSQTTLTRLFFGSAAGLTANGAMPLRRSEAPNTRARSAVVLMPATASRVGRSGKMPRAAMPAVSMQLA